MELAPIIVFAFNRPEHTRQTLEALMQNHLADKSELFIYIDGPRTKDEIEKVNSVKKIAEEKLWCGKVSVVESKTNKGLAASVVKGVTDIVNKYGKVIVLEDDLVSDKWFLKFMNDSLTVYENETDVVCATGYIYPVSKALPETFFLKGADCWGWATWKRGWDILEINGDGLLKELEEKSDF
ncbi:MAG: glycosyltransferase [Sphingobacteriaceae bacterium]|nr:glycosyltransferase [Sphingobacteriaceae bacterium]